MLCSLALGDAIDVPSAFSQLNQAQQPTGPHAAGKRQPADALIVYRAAPVMPQEQKRTREARCGPRQRDVRLT